eukprot:Ihof_evm7s151 gene=Ihof_evmTU7s151
MAQEESGVAERIGSYKVLYVMGSGSFAQVSVGEHTKTGEKVALKVVNTALWSEKNKARRTTLLKREIRLCRLLHHPNVIRMIGTMQDGLKVILVMEHGEGGDLENFIYAQKNRYLPEPKACDLIRQVISGVDYLHKNFITHRDIKPANIILDPRHMVPKLIDFGFTNIFDEKEKMASFLGSPHFAAPELLTGTKYEGPQVDIWSLGVTLFACLTGRLPFQSSTMEKLMDLIIKAEFDFPPHVSEDAQNLIKHMLMPDPSKRAKMEDVRHHPWMNIGYSSPPADLAIPRSAAVTQIDETVLAALASYGFEDKEGNRQAIVSEGTNVPKVVYCLLLEARARERQRQMIEAAKLAANHPVQPVQSNSRQSSPGGSPVSESRKHEKDHKTLATAMKHLLSPLMGRKERKHTPSDPLPVPQKETTESNYDDANAHSHQFTPPPSAFAAPASAADPLNPPTNSTAPTPTPEMAGNRADIGAPPM